MERIHDYYRPAEERKIDFNEVERLLSAEEIRPQVERCLACGVPFCHGYGCPLGNLVPDQNRAVARGDLRKAYELLSVNSDFPEFTARVCPAICESCCVHQLDEESVMVRQSEKLIIETAFANGWVVPRPPAKENGKRAAVIGAGPAGLSAAVTLRRKGWAVTVYERNHDIGGLLRYGIPCFKLDKAVIDRRRKILEAEGIVFETDTEVGTDVSAEYLKRTNDAIVVAIGTPAARDLTIPGRELAGIHLALEFLGGQNRFLTGETSTNPISAKDKRVLVIGGGGTARRKPSRRISSSSRWASRASRPTTRSSVSSALRRRRAPRSSLSPRQTSTASATAQAAPHSSCAPSPAERPCSPFSVQT